MGRKRRTDTVCKCDAYAFPHRLGGGTCGEFRESEDFDPFDSYRRQMEAEWASDRRPDVMAINRGERW